MPQLERAPPWMVARGFQAVIDERHGCSVTAASVDSSDCQVGAVNDNLRVASTCSYSAQRAATARFDQAAKSGHHKGPAMGQAIDHALARTECAHVACRPRSRQLPRICHAPDRLRQGLCRTWRESIANGVPPALANRTLGFRRDDDANVVGYLKRQCSRRHAGLLQVARPLKLSFRRAGLQCSLRDWMASATWD